MVLIIFLGALVWLYVKVYKVKWNLCGLFVITKKWLIIFETYNNCNRSLKTSIYYHYLLHYFNCVMDTEITLHIFTIWWNGYPCISNKPGIFMYSTVQINKINVVYRLWLIHIFNDCLLPYNAKKCLSLYLTILICILYKIESCNSFLLLG